MENYDREITFPEDKNMRDKNVGQPEIFNYESHIRVVPQIY